MTLRSKVSINRDEIYKVEVSNFRTKNVSNLFKIITFSNVIEQELD